MPQRLGRRRGIERVDGVVLGRDVDDGVRAFRWNVHRREIEHLGIHVAVHGDDVDLANVTVFTVRGVSCVSVGYAPVRALSYCAVVT